ncbi:MAG: DNA mismatch repair protein MutS, partial [Chitinophagaceae bacterium]
MAKSSADTPLMKQHKAIKQKYPDAILLFRVGDFYETFGSDAIITSKVLGITLTKRNNNSDTTNELAGFPHHALDTYLHKLVKAGYRVAICDQLEDPKLAKGIIKRGVTEMVTPGIATNDKLLEHNSNNFLACVHLEENKNGLALLDITTGEFLVAEGNEEYIDKLLQSLKPSEVILQRNMLKKFKEFFGVKFYTYTLDSWIFESNYTTEILLKHFQTHSLKGFGIENMQSGIMAAGAILHYLKETEHPHLQHISSIQRLEEDDHVWMDRFTIRNLEILPEGYNAENCLLKTLDNTITSMGARLLKRWIVLP